MKASINSLHHQAGDWLRELDFYKEELRILTKRLEEVASKNTSKDVLAEVEHFQNRFIILREQFDILHHENGERFGRLDELAKVRPDHIEEKFVADNDTMYGRLNNFFSSFRDTRFEFNKFLAKVM